MVVIRERTCAECGRTYWIERRRALAVRVCFRCHAADHVPDPEPVATAAGRDRLTK